MAPTSQPGSRQPFLVGVDLGTSSIKVAAFTLDGALIGLERATTPTSSPREGWIENDAEEVWTVVATLLQQLLHRTESHAAPAAIAVASVGESGLPIDRGGTPLRNIIAWNDARAGAQAQWWENTFGRDQMRRVSGQTLDPHYGVNKLLWIRDNEPHLFERTDRWLSLADWIGYRLCGETVTDPTLASRTMVFDQAKSRWSSDLISAAGLSMSLFPEVVQSGTRIAGVSSAAAAATGLPQGLSVVAAGHDRLCGSFAVRGNSQSVIDSTGSAEALVVPVTEYVPRGEVEAGYVSSYADVIPGNYVYSARVGYAGTLLDWFRSLVQRGHDTAEYVDLVDEIPQPLRFSGLLTFPSFGRVVTPFWDRRAAPGALAGLQLSHTRGHIAQALIEGVTYSLRANLEWVETLSGVTAPELRVEGGVTRSPVWMQIKADITGREIHAVTLEEPTALGAALLAGVGAGEFASHAESTRDLVVPLQTWVPEPARREVYDRVFSEGYLPFAATQARVNQVLIDAVTSE